MFVCCECCVLSGRGLCDELITRPEESYRLWRVVVCDQESSKTRRLKARYRAVKIQPQGVVTPGKQTVNIPPITIINTYMKLKIFCRCSLFPSWSCEGLISTPVLYGFKEERNTLHSLKHSITNWTGYTLRRNCITNHIIAGKTEEMGRRERRCEQLLQYAGISKRTQYIALCGQLAFEDAMVLSQDTIRND
jgi:hypothetical protein